MCGRFTLGATEAQVLRKFKVGACPGLRPRYNIAPTQPVLVVRAARAGEGCDAAPREAAWLNWGLVPFWAKDVGIGSRLINARSETAAEKAAFRGPMRHHRCLLPASGFYEWQRAGRGRGPAQAFYFTAADGGLLALAGVFDVWQSADGSVIESCAVLTTRANAAVARIHDRMPVLLEVRDFERWLDPALQRPDALRDLLVPCEPGLLRVHAVSSRVNAATTEGPDLIAPEPCEAWATDEGAAQGEGAGRAGVGAPADESAGKAGAEAAGNVGKQEAGAPGPRAASAKKPRARGDGARTDGTQQDFFGGLFGD